MVDRVLSMSLSVTCKSPEPETTMAVRSSGTCTFGYNGIKKTSILAGRNVDISKSEKN